jgi:hypothetical protein
MHNCLKASEQLSHLGNVSQDEQAGRESRAQPTRMGVPTQTTIQSLPLLSNPQFLLSAESALVGGGIGTDFFDMEKRKEWLICTIGDKRSLRRL